MLLLVMASTAVTPALAQVAPSDRDYWPTAGWRSAEPATRGMDPELLAAADARIRAELPYLTSMLVVRGGDLVFEGYYGDFTETDTLEIWSTTKSVTATVVGIAVGEGLLRVDQTVGELIPDRIPVGADPRAATVTVQHLLTMTSGFAWDSGTDFSFAFDEVDPTERALGLAMTCDPGTCYEYNSGNVNVLSSIVQTVSGQTLAEYAQPRLFDPLGITQPVWRSSVVGETLGAVGLSLTPRDLAKIGYLYLNAGVWDGAQIVPAAWIEAATSTQSSGANAAGVNLGPGSYGYLWWISEIGGFPAYFALGVGRQFVYVVPTLDLVIVATSSNLIPYEVPIQQQQQPQPIVEELIVPAATGPVISVSTAPATPESVAAAPTVAGTPMSQAAASVATPTASGRVFALPSDHIFPDGIAFGPATGDFYVGSTIDGAIARGNLERGDVQTLNPGRDGTTALGLELDGQGRLFVAGGQSGFVAVYDSTGERLAEVGNGLGPNTFLNDIAVTPAGDAYITDSWNPLLFRLSAAALSEGNPGELEVFLDLSTTPFVYSAEGYNADGIVATPDGQFLLILQNNTGALYRVELATQAVIQVDLGDRALASGNGLALEDQTLYAVTGDEITVVELAGDFSNGTVTQTFSDPSFSSPTSIVPAEGCLLVVNSQIANAQDTPDLPFTVSSIAVPTASATTPVAAANC